MDNKNYIKYLKIVEAGLLNIRLALNANDIGQAKIELDHIHNLPGLIYDYLPEKEKYYWDVEKKEYEKEAEKDYIESFKPIWEE